MGHSQLRLQLLTSGEWRRSRATHPITAWVCAALACLAIYVMVTESFLWYQGDETFFTGVMILSPFLLAIGPLVRSRAWFGACGAGLFVATSLAMLTHNGLSRYSGVGFFGHWVS